MALLKPILIEISTLTLQNLQVFLEKRSTGNLKSLLRLTKQLTVERLESNTCICKIDYNATGLEIDSKVSNMSKCLKKKEFLTWTDYCGLTNSNFSLQTNSTLQRDLVLKDANPSLQVLNALSTVLLTTVLKR